MEVATCEWLALRYFEEFEVRSWRLIFNEVSDFQHKDSVDLTQGKLTPKKSTNNLCYSVFYFPSERKISVISSYRDIVPFDLNNLHLVPFESLDRKLR